MGASLHDVEPPVGRRLGPRFIRFLSASTLSSLGDGVRLVAFPLLAVTMTRSPLLVAGVSLMSNLPYLLLGLLSGALADRVDRRRAMIFADISRAILMAVLALALIIGWENLALLYVVAFFVGAAETLFDSCANAMLPAIVRDEHLERANGLLETAIWVNNDFAGRALGSVMFAAVIWLPFFADAGSFVLSALLLLSVAGAYPGGVDREGTDVTIRVEIAEALRWVWRHHVVRALTLLSALLNLCVYATEAILVLFAIHVIHVDVAVIGTLFGASAIGGLAGSLGAERICKRIGISAAIVSSVGLLAISQMVTGLTSSVWLVAAMQIVLGFGTGIYVVSTVTLRQRLVPDHLRGRAHSAHRLVSWGAIPIGAALGGVLASINLRTPFLVTGAVLAVATVAIGMGAGGLRADAIAGRQVSSS